MIIDLLLLLISKTPNEQNIRSLICRSYDAFVEYFK